jgi:hypothetical protein
MLCVESFEESDRAREQESSNFTDEECVNALLSGFDEDIKDEVQGESCSSSFSASFYESSVLMITNHAHNKTVRPSPRRFYPFRGISTQTSRQVEISFSFVSEVNVDRGPILEEPSLCTEVSFGRTRSISAGVCLGTLTLYIDYCVNFRRFKIFRCLSVVIVKNNELRMKP